MKQFSVSELIRERGWSTVRPGDISALFYKRLIEDQTS